MSFPINVNIPAAGDDPADDQPIIQQNFSNINGYLQVDHTNPSGVNAGIHKQSTYISTAATGPGIGGGIGAIFANATIVPGSAYPYWQNAASIFSIALGSKVNPGTGLPFVPTVSAVNGVINIGGIIFQWGLSTVVKSATNTISFSPAFTTVFNVEMSPMKSGSGTDDAWISAPANNANFNVNNNSSSITQVYWFAIGS